MDDTSSYASETERIIKETLSAHIGTEPEDIDNEDALREELGLNSISMTDVIEELKQQGLAAEKISFDEVETVEDLIDLLDLESDI